MKKYLACVIPALLGVLISHFLPEINPLTDLHRSGEIAVLAHTWFLVGFVVSGVLLVTAILYDLFSWMERRGTERDLHRINRR